MPRAGERTARSMVFPNPYRVEARWDQGATVRDHYLWFAGLPARCGPDLFTLAGDRVFETRFDGAAYRGQGTRGLYDPRQDLDTPPPVLSGTELRLEPDHATRARRSPPGSTCSRSRTSDSGQVQRGKFLVVKSDIE